MVDIIDAIKSEVGEELILLIKINCSDFEYGGLEEVDFVEICEIIDKAGIDGIEVSGNFTSRPKIKAGINESYFRNYAEMLEDKVKCPVILVGGNRSIENMNDVLNETSIEYLSLSRPLICEPGLIKRWMDGDVSLSRCISCNNCYQTFNHKCIFNQ